MQSYHVTWGGYGQWLPGDPRGFRSRDARILSSGDYKHYPPPGEYAGLHRYAQRLLKRPPVELPHELRVRVLAALVEKVHEMKLDAL